MLPYQLYDNKDFDCNESAIVAISESQDFSYESSIMSFNLPDLQKLITDIEEENKLSNRDASDSHRTVILISQVKNSLALEF